VNERLGIERRKEERERGGDVQERIHNERTFFLDPPET
jgi:hypothetical protein